MIEAKQHSEERRPNRLHREKSPYLLQHAYNPVDWYAWGEEAFAAARAADKPIFLSIGYSTCHWCHVMERESFEDPEVAALMNDAFINIKVDREERPDLDAVYMSACQALSGQGGWPLTIVMTPDQKPFYAATYLPKRAGFGRVGMMEMAPRIKELWATQRDKITSAADQVTAELNRPAGQCGGEAPGEADLVQAQAMLANNFDRERGGFGDSPKFPTPHNLLFLLRRHARTGDAEPLAMVERTLTAMRAGGIFDHAGFGFHRYSTDREWFAPHFEKMLYDQALLILAYLEAFQVTGKAEYERTAREVIDYVLRDLTSPDGAFLSAEDADSEGVEGKFYLWTTDEMRSALGDDADLAIRVFGASDAGNFGEAGLAGANILHLPRPLVEVAAELGLGEAELNARLKSVRLRLFAVRAQRVRPFLDDKVLTDWNGLMIAALARAAWVLGEPALLAAAAKSALFIREQLRDEGGRLFHRRRDGESAGSGFLDDYAFLTWGLIELYEAGFDPAHLEWALELNRLMLEHFEDPAVGGLFQSADDGETTIVRPKDAYDGATPSGNSVAMHNLLRLSRLTADPELERQAESVLRSFYCTVRKALPAYTHMLSALDFALGPAAEVVIVGTPGAADAAALLDALRRRYLPCQVALFKDIEDPADRIGGLAEYTRELTALSGRATAYVCRGFRCDLPTTDPERMKELLEGPEESMT